MSRYLFLATVFCLLIFRLDLRAAQIQLLHLGDSQTDLAFGEELHSFYLEFFESEEIRLLGVSGSSVRHWAQNKRSNDVKWLCSQHGRVGANQGWSIGWEVCREADWISPFSEANREHPQKVVFQFLGNSMGRSKEFIADQVQSLMSQLRESQKCFFLTSPPFHRSRGSRNVLRKQTEDFIVEAISGRCVVFRGMSLKYFADREDFYVEDRVHLSRRGARAFLDEVRMGLEEFLRD